MYYRKPKPETMKKNRETARQQFADEMKSGDYEHLIKTFDEYFGCIIDLER